MTATATHAMTRAGRDLFAARPVCNVPGVPAHRLVIPTSGAMLSAVSCRRCRVALNWPAEMDPLPQRRVSEPG